MRLIAWAAVFVLLIEPESVTGPSFQMSFAAVCALIATYETVRGRFRAWRHDAGPARRLGLYVASVVLTSVVATLATAPYSVFMPWAIAAFVLMPFGLEGWALAPMSWGVEGVIWTAKTVAAWPGAVMLLPAMPDAALALITFGGLWLCLWRRAWRRAGLAPIALGIALMAAARPPDLLIEDSGKVVGLRGADGALALTSARAAKFETGIWLRRNGQDAPAEPHELACDGAACVWQARGQAVALVRRPDAFAEECRLAAVVVSPTLAAPRGCRDPPAVIDKWSLWREGAHAVYLAPEGVRVETARGVSGDRPWVRKPERAARERRAARAQ
jgi:competence protein ComEC